MLLASLPLVQAQDTVAQRKAEKATIKPYGFVRNYLNIDSRRMMTVCGGEYLMIPYDEDWNMTETFARTYDIADERFDRNAVHEAHLLALSSRFGLAIEGGRLGQGTLSGKLEGDFAGFGTNNTVLRLRLAYMQWDVLRGRLRHTLLVGQDWHPLSGSIMPNVLGMAAGAPFRPHSRTPQLRYTIYGATGLGITAAALWQYQFTSPGPEGESTKYANRSLVPELFLGLNYKTEDIYAQLGVDYTNILVRQELPVTDGGLSYTYLDAGRCYSISPTVYFQYTPGLFSLKMRSTLARNLAHLNMLSGYAWAVNSANEMTYIPMQASVSYLDISYGKRWRFDIFLGYHKNLGLADKDYTIAGAISSNLYMKKDVININSIYRLAPSISYNTKTFNIGLEYEVTGVTYGRVNLVDGTVPNDDHLHQVLGHRLCAMVKYNF